MYGFCGWAPLTMGASLMRLAIGLSPNKARVSQPCHVNNTAMPTPQNHAGTIASFLASVDTGRVDGWKATGSTFLVPWATGEKEGRARFFSEIRSIAVYRK